MKLNVFYAQGASLFATVFLIRFLMQNYGVYNLLYSLIAMMSILFSLAFILQRYMSESYSRGDYTIAFCLYCYPATARLLSSVIILGFAMLLCVAISPILKISEFMSYVILWVADQIFVPYLEVICAAIAAGTATLGKNFFFWFFVREHVAMTGMLHDSLKAHRLLVACFDMHLPVSSLHACRSDSDVRDRLLRLGDTLPASVSLYFPEQSSLSAISNKKIMSYQLLSVELP